MNSKIILQWIVRKRILRQGVAALKIGLIVVLASNVFAEQVELITTFESEEQMGVSIRLSEMVDYVEEMSQSPPRLKLIFPKAGFAQERYSKQMNLPPLYRIDALERRGETKSTEVVLHFTTIPEYHIETDGGTVVRVSWKPEIEAVSRRAKARRLSTLETTVSLSFRGAKLVDILRLLAVQNNLNIIAGEDVKGEVTVSLTDVNLGTALDAILKVNGYDWFMQENIVVIKPTDKQMTGELETRIYKLEYVDASAVSLALTNVLTPKGKIQVFSPVMKGGLIGGGRGAGAAGAAGAGAGAAGGGGLLGALAGGAAGGAAGAVTPGAGAAGRGGAAGGLGVPAMDHLLVTDAHHNFDRIEEIVYRLDKQIPQINISVKFIETKLAMDERLGINWSLRSTLTGPATGDTTTALQLSLGKWKSLRIATLSLPIFTALLDMLASDNDTRLLQEPQVTTFDNTMATVNVGTTIPVLVPQPQGGLVGAQPFTFQDEEITITLNVQPRINEERFVSMTINATVQALVGYAGPQADRPIVSERSTQTQVMVGDGETLLIGGLIFDQITESESHLPFLGRLPVIRKFFTHTSTTSEQRELLIFITPNIVRLT